MLLNLVALPLLRRLSIQRVVKVDEVSEELVQAKNDVMNAASRHPAKAIQRILAEQAQADAAVFVYVWVPDSGKTFHNRRLTNGNI